MSKYITYSALIAVAAFVFEACTPAGGEYAGTEYVPDMGHSIAYEANVLDDYSNHTWDEQSTFTKKALSGPRLPVPGTVARGYVGVSAGNADAVMAELHGLNSVQGIRVTPNGNVPYYYGNTDEERARAIAEIKANPFAVSKVGLEKGKQLYDIYCGICHGTKGDGAGYLVSDENPKVKYPNQPANLMQDEFIAASNGRYYHAIMHGKGVMGGYADKLSYEERWQVIHHIRSLQATAKGKDYLKGEVATAAATQTAAQQAAKPDGAAPAAAPQK